MNYMQTGNKMDAATQIINKSLAVNGNVSKQDMQPCLAIQLKGEIYALAIQSIRDIVEYGNIAVLPGQPDFICGTRYFRGGMIPVIDPGLRFNKHSMDVWQQPCIVVIQVATGRYTQDIGVMGDWVSNMQDTRGIEGEPVFLGGNISFDFMDSKGKINGKSVILLSVDQLLSSGAMAVTDNRK